MNISTSLAPEDLSALMQVITDHPDVPDDLTVAVPLAIQETRIPFHRSAGGLTEIVVTLGSAAAIRAFAQIVSAYFSSHRTEITLRHRGQTLVLHGHDSNITKIIPQLKALLGESDSNG